MKVIKVVTTIASSENVYLVLKAISSVHVARTWRLSSILEVEPSHLLKIEDVHVVSCKWSGTKPSSNYVKPVLY